MISKFINTDGAEATAYDYAILGYILGAAGLAITLTIALGGL